MGADREPLVGGKRLRKSRPIPLELSPERKVRVSGLPRYWHRLDRAKKSGRRLASNWVVPRKFSSLAFARGVFLFDNSAPKRRTWKEKRA